MFARSNYIVVALLTVCASGCGPKPGAKMDPAAGPFGSPQSSAVMSPFSGAWVIDPEKTLEAMRAGGMDAGYLETIRRSFAERPGDDQFHPNLTFVDDVAMGDDRFSSEYRFFRMHKHGTKACGLAWHHEDRFDPGDMSKCYVRLELIGAELHMDVFMEEDPPSENDPDLVSGSPGEVDAAECRFDAHTTNDPEHWTYLVLRRK